jgi:hypothetical protein
MQKKDLSARMDKQTGKREKSGGLPPVSQSEHRACWGGRGGAMRHTTGQGPKAKGRTFEKEVVASILATYPELISEHDVLFRSMGSIGADIILSEAARAVLPLAIECKRVGRLENLDLNGAMKQAKANCPTELVPCVVYREDRHDTFVSLTVGGFMALMKTMPGDVKESMTLDDFRTILTLRWADLLQLLGASSNGVL